MKGVIVRKIKLVHEDSRRKMMEIMNGEMTIKNIKILIIKETSYLGGHWHQYPECMFVLKGSCKDYKMTNIDTKETEIFQLEEGDVVFRTGRIIHGGTFIKDSIVIDGACESYINAEFNDIQEKVK
jgi:hypothetical protein